MLARRPRDLTWLGVVAISLVVSTLAFGGQLLSQRASIEVSARCITSVLVWTWLISISTLIWRKARRIDLPSTKALKRLAWIIPVIFAAILALALIAPGLSQLSLRPGQRVTVQVTMPKTLRFNQNRIYFKYGSALLSYNIVYDGARTTQGQCAVLSGTIQDLWPDLPGWELLVDEVRMCP